MVLPIYVYGAEVLREKSKEVDITIPGIGDELRTLISDMWETMEKADGVGFAAPQVGKSIRVLIVDGTLLSDDMPELKDFKRAMINPVIIKESKETIEYSEGCLSIPDIHAGVIRPRVITVSYYDENLVKKEEQLDNFACRMVQHEMDHLEGILFTDLVAPIRKKMLQSRLNNIMAGKAKPHYRIVQANRKK
ncbi:MAG: def [Bacteroidetes bacterium]|nr:def [Bacteroidota bacterium]